MSLHVSGLVIRRYRGKPHLKLTLLILADRASDDGVCWPSYGEIAAKIGVSKRSAIRNVNDLVEADLLAIVAKGGRFVDPQTHQHRGYGNRFIVNVPALEAMPLLYDPTPSCPQDVVDGCHPLHNMGDAHVTHPSTPRVTPTSPRQSYRQSGLTVRGESPVENVVGPLLDAWTADN